jgi:transcriptional regulator with XRE-family HTH domain
MAKINRVLMRKLRREKGFTQQELAEKTGIGQSYICKIESGDMEPSVKRLGKIAKALGTTVKELIKE